MTARNDGTGAPTDKAAGTLARAARLFSAGKRTQAETLCRRILAGQPDHPGAFNLLGIMAADGGNLTAALGHFEAAVAAHPDFDTGRVNLARAQLQDGRPDDAAETLAAITSTGPPNAEALNVLGVVLRAQGQAAQAIDAFRRAVAARADYVEALSNLANATLEAGDLAAANGYFRRLVDLRPDDSGARSAWATVLWRLGDGASAMEHFRRVLDSHLDDSAAIIGIARCLGTLSPIDHDPAIEAALMTCFASADVRHQDLARIAATVIKTKYGVGPVAGADDALSLALTLAADPLFAALMTRTVNIDRDLELLLNGVRRTLLLVPNATTGPEGPVLLSLLAIQGFNNAYVAWHDESEADALETLEKELTAAGDPGDMPDPDYQARLLRFALYRPVADLATADALAAVPRTAWSSALAPVVEQTLIEVREEAMIAEAIPRFGSIDDAVSMAVRGQYEDSPYPRWLSAERLPRLDLASRLTGLFPAADTGGLPVEPLDVMVAGCGTGVQLIHHASTGPDDRILAVDLSRRSLAYAQRMAGRLGVDGIEYLQADILALGDLDRMFDVIISTGVLHHLADPARGWRMLTGLLRPGGAINIALYGARPRAVVAEACQRVRERGLQPSPSDIRAFRRQAMTSDDLVSIAIRTRWEDFYDLDGCRDMFFHVHEQEFTVADLARMIAEQGLDFLGFDFSDPATPQAYRREHPDDPAMTDFTRWAEFEQVHPDIFVGMYNFWCRKPAA